MSGKKTGDSPDKRHRGARFYRSSQQTEGRTFVRLFQARFAALVEAGTKTQTVRPPPKVLPSPGDWISCRAWMGRPRRSKQRVLRKAPITGVNHIKIEARGRIWLQGVRLDLEAANKFAHADGFTGYVEMIKWFQITHGLPFEGIVIYWES